MLVVVQVLFNAIDVVNIQLILFVQLCHEVEDIGKSGKSTARKQWWLEVGFELFETVFTQYGSIHLFRAILEFRYCLNANNKETRYYSNNVN